MTDGDARAIEDAISAIGPAPGLRLLVVFGSRARRDAGPSSDWDIGVLGDSGFDVDSLRAPLTERLGTDRIDLVDLTRASGQLRYRAARDGRPVFTRTPDEWSRFWMEAVSFWCDAGPVLGPAYRGVLLELGP